MSPRKSSRAPEDETLLEAEDENDFPAPRLRRRARAETGDRETVMHLIRDVPHFAKLFYRLARDPRVSRLDKGLVLAALGYILLPEDLIPDEIPYLGHVDDVFLLALAFDRLLRHAGIDVLLDHWDGDPASLEMVIAALDRAGSILPDRLMSLLPFRRG
jgi:uncharacterized membrane protein YkvA (DUF1232 family)